MMIQLRIASQIVSVVLGGPQKPPADLLKISRDIGVAEIRPTKFRDGFTDFSSGAPVIYLNHMDCSARMRFIFAHELAHVMLRMPEVIQLIHMQGRADLLTDEEKLADRVAGTILVPDVWVEALRKTHSRLERLENVAQRANVSLTMLIARMASSDIDVGLLHWRKGNNAWHVVDRPGVPASLHGYVKPSAIGYRAIENLGRDESDIVVDCHISGRRAKISGTGHRRNGYLLQLIEPSRDIWIAPQSSQAELQSRRRALHIQARSEGRANQPTGQGLIGCAIDSISAPYAPRPAVISSDRRYAPIEQAAGFLGHIGRSSNGAVAAGHRIH